jgi:hypothetical protein
MDSNFEIWSPIHNLNANSKILIFGQGSDFISPEDVSNNIIERLSSPYTFNHEIETWHIDFNKMIDSISKHPDHHHIIKINMIGLIKSIKNEQIQLLNTLPTTVIILCRNINSYIVGIFINKLDISTLIIVPPLLSKHDYSIFLNFIYFIKPDVFINILRQKYHCHIGVVTTEGNCYRYFYQNNRQIIQKKNISHNEIRKNLQKLLPKDIIEMIIKFGY